MFSLCTSENKTKIIRGFSQNFLWILKIVKNLMKIEFCGDKYLKFWSFINLPCGHVMFSRFDVYWIQTNRQTPRQAKFIDRWGLTSIFNFQGKQHPVKNSDSFQILKIIEQHSILFIKKQFVKNIQKCDLGALKWKKLGKTQNSPIFNFNLAIIHYFVKCIHYFVKYVLERRIFK